MSCHAIYYKDGAKMMRPVLTREEYLSLRNSPEQVNNVKRVRLGEEALKPRLLQMNYSCLPNEDGSLKGSKRLSTTVGMDIDHIPQGQMQTVKECILMKKDELGLLMLELSARRQGYHLVFRRRPDLSQEENLRWASDLLGVDYDKGAKDITRVFFTTTASQEDLLFLDDGIFTASPGEPGEPGNPGNSGNSGETGNSGNSGNAGASGAAAPPADYHGVPYARIIEEWLGGEQVKVGDRHRTSLCLADHLRYITENDARQIELLLRQTPFVADIIRERGEDVARTVADAQKYELLRGIPKRMREALKRAGVDDVKDEGDGDPAVPKETTMDSPLSDIYACMNPPAMPREMPKLIKLLTKNTPDCYKPTVAHAVFPSLAVHLHDVKFLYTDNTSHEATLMNVAMAGTGAGKACIDEPINRIMADIRERDSENEQRLDEYNQEVNRKSANKDKRERPGDLIIQEVHPDVTHAALVLRLSEAQGRFLYMKLNEIELFDKLRGSGGQQFVIMCQAFDANNRYGQSRASTQSVNATVQLRFNWNAAGTIGAVTRYFWKVLTKGPISRINFCTIPEREIGSPQPQYGIYDEDFDKHLKPFITNLTAASGTVNCKQARKLAQRLIEECAEFSRLSQDRVFENLSFRANLIAYLKACVLYVANGCKWEKSMEAFIRWSLHYDLWCKMRFFGEGIRSEDAVAVKENRKGPQNLLELLPDEFTLEDAKKVRRMKGKDASDRETAHMIRTWMGRGYCAQRTAHSFKKDERFKRLKDGR